MAVKEYEEIPPDLLSEPSGIELPPPIATAAQTLPFWELPWDDFEKFCLRLARLGGPYGRSRRYGDPGQAQYGIDFYTTLPTGRYVTYQCKRKQAATKSDIKAAVSEFLKHKRWSDVSDKFVLCTSARAVRTELGDAIEAQAKRLAKRTPAIEFEVWDAEELSILLKEHEELTRDFFGPVWTAAFFGKAFDPDQFVDDIAEKVVQRMQARTQFFTHDWASERLRDLLEALRNEEPGTFGSFNDLFGSPPDTELVRAAIKAPPAWLQSAPARVWDVLARLAESRGEWTAASIAWERLSERQATEAARAGSLVSAAIAATMGGESERHDEVIKRAEEIDARHPRLVLAQLSEDTPPAEVLAIVRDLHSDDLDDQVQILARRALAELLTPDVEAARSSTEEVAGLLPDSILAATLSISVTVQEGRLAIMGHSPLDRRALEAAASDAGATRDRLIEQKRWSESTRLLMLKADIFALLGDRPKAAKVLREARDDEQKTTEQKVVLASSAAERALNWELAAYFLRDAEETATTARLRMEISEAIGTPAEREKALKDLEGIVDEGGPEAEHAAFVRLAATLGAAPTPWSEKAATYLRENGHERAAAQAEAFYRQRESGYEAGVAVLAPYGDAPWALASRLRLALSPKAPPEAAVEAAERLLTIVPSHANRIEAAQAYGRAKDFTKAKQELTRVARDVSAPDPARADACEKLMHVAGNELDDWDFTAEIYDLWMKVSPADSRAPQWAPRIANRRTRKS
jgi:hypothetical protein